LTLLILFAAVFAWNELDTSGRIVILTGSVPSALVALRFLPRWRYLEISDGGDVWMIRQQFGWSSTRAQIKKADIAMATVERDEKPGPAYPTHFHVQLSFAHELPFVRRRAEPMKLASAFALPVPVLLEICRMLAPGNSERAYLISYDAAYGQLTQ
jgi:hypothetical protein